MKITKIRPPQEGLNARQLSKGCNLEYRAAKIYDKEIYEHDKL